MKHIEMTVTTNERAQDVFRLKTEPEHIDVVLTEDNGTNDLKNLFARLLQELFKDDVEIKFVKTDGYKTRIYEDVCREYVSTSSRWEQEGTPMKYNLDKLRKVELRDVWPHEALDFTK